MYDDDENRFMIKMWFLVAERFGEPSRAVFGKRFFVESTWLHTIRTILQSISVST